MIFPRDSRGQTFIESAIALPIAIFGVSAFFVLIWGLCISLIAHHTLDEMLICRELFPEPTNCQESAQQRLHQVLLFGKLQKIQLQRNSDQSFAEASITLPFHLNIHVKESLALPLGPE